MANDGINQGDLTSGSTYYLRIRNNAGLYYYTVTPVFEAYNAAHIASYVVSAAAANGAGGYHGTFPTNATTVAGIYDLELCLRSGGSGAEGDDVVAVATIWWDGANILVPLGATTAWRTLDVSATGGAGLDWANVESPTTTVSLTNTSVILSATGLNAIPVTDPGTVASTFPQMIVQLWRRFFKKTVLDSAGNTLKTYADNGTDVDTTQTTAVTSTTQTQGPAT